MGEWTVDVIREKITTDRRWTERGLIALYERQTSQEQDGERTIECNHQGFNALDAEILTSFSKWLLSGRPLTNRQLACAQKKLAKYAGQLTAIANN